MVYCLLAQVMDSLTTTRWMLQKLQYGRYRRPASKPSLPRCDQLSFSTLITPWPTYTWCRGPVLFCSLASVVVCRRLQHSTAGLQAASPAHQAMTSCHLQSNYSSTVTLHGGPVVLRPVRATLYGGTDRRHTVTLSLPLDAISEITYSNTAHSCNVACFLV